MPLRIDDVAHVARLARLNLPPEELQRYTHELAVILQYIDQLSSVDTTGVEPRAMMNSAENVWRADQVQPSLPRSEALRNAPAQDGEYFLVPKVLG